MDTISGGTADAADAFFERFSTAAAANSGSASSSTTDPQAYTFLNDNDDSLSLPEAPLDGLPLVPSRSVIQISPDLLRILKANAGLGEKAENELDNFLTATEPEQRVMQFCATLQLRELLREAVKAKSDIVALSSKLKFSITVFTRAFLLSPALTVYRGNDAEYILAAMRELNTHDLPAPREVAHCKEVLKQIQDTLTNFRSVIKDEIKASLVMADDGSPSDNQNIAVVAAGLVSKSSGLQLTLQHCIRIAWLRWAIGTVGTTVPNAAFWVCVDKLMEDLRKKFDTESALTSALKANYDADKTQYGDPANIDNVIIVDPKNIPKWQTVIDKHAASVLGQTQTAAKKRKVGA